MPARIPDTLILQLDVGKVLATTSSREWEHELGVVSGFRTKHFVDQNFSQEIGGPTIKKVRVRIELILIEEKLAKWMGEAGQ